MKDGIIKGTGNSRYLKGAGWPATYEEFRSMAETGALPFDLNGINEAGWQQIGDALNRANLLDDATCLLLRLDADMAVPNAALQKIILGNKYAWGITIKDSNGNALKDVTVSGLTRLDGSAAVTDSSGYVLAVSDSATVSISIESPYLDLQSISATPLTHGSSTITAISLTMQTRVTTVLEISSSKSFSFSPDVEFADFCIVGAGGGGAAFYTINSNAGGGGGGYVINLLNQTIASGDTFTATIGAGGAGAQAVSGSAASAIGGNGGGSVLYKNGTVIGSPNGGYGGSQSAGGAGNGAGGITTNGTAGSVYKFGESAFGLLSGGGAGCVIYSGTTLSGGSPYGGSGKLYNASGPGNAGTGPGGGGAAAPTNAVGGSGYRGAVFVRWRYKS